MNKCPRPATIQYTWANQFKIACLEHANAMAKIGEVIGAPISAQTIVTDKPCEHMDDLEPPAKEEAM